VGVLLQTLLSTSSTSPSPSSSRDVEGRLIDLLLTVLGDVAVSSKHRSRRDLVETVVRGGDPNSSVGSLIVTIVVLAHEL
jgi:hypothetical protein